jgi:hypothetical protein
VNINDDGMGPYIVNFSSLLPLALLNIVDGTYVNKCPIATPLWPIWVATINALVPTFSEWLKWKPK